jgi:Flp pilus assembly protein CpaB
MSASVYGYRVMARQIDRESTMMDTVKPVRLLQSGEIIERGMLRMVPIPKSAHQPDAELAVSELIGRTVIVPIADHEELSVWKLARTDIVPAPDERYVSFKTDAVTNVNNMIRRGDRVDVWVEFDTPKAVKSEAGAAWTVGAVKIIENVKVAGVKTAEGIEVFDNVSLDAVLQSSQTQLQNARSKPNGKPELNTYIMDDVLQEAYSLGMLGGKIKLTLPNVSGPDRANPEAASVTALFKELKAADAFSKSKQQTAVTVPGGPETSSSSSVSTADKRAHAGPEAAEVK